MYETLSLTELIESGTSGCYDPSHSMFTLIAAYIENPDPNLVLQHKHRYFYGFALHAKELFARFPFSNETNALVDIFALMIQARIQDSFYSESLYETIALLEQEQLERVVSKVLECGGTNRDVMLMMVRSLNRRLEFGGTHPDEASSQSVEEWSFQISWIPPKELTLTNSLERYLWDQSDEDLYWLLQAHTLATNNYGSKDWFIGPLQVALALFRPEPLRRFLNSIQTSTDADHSVLWRWLLTSDSTEFDEDCLRYCRLCSQEEGITTLIHLDSARNGAFQKITLEACLHPELHITEEVLVYLAKNDVEQLPEASVRWLQHPDNRHMGEVIQQVLSMSLNVGGKATASLLNYLRRCSWDNRYGNASKLKYIIQALCDAEQLPNQELAETVTTLLENGKEALRYEADSSKEIWSLLSTRRPAAFTELFQQELIGSSKPRREASALGLVNAMGDAVLPMAKKHLSAKKADTRKGGIALLKASALPDAIPVLNEALERENSDKVRKEIQQALESLGEEVVSELGSAHSSPEEIRAAIEQQRKRIKLPKSTWLHAESLPVIPTKAGGALSTLEVSYLIQKQAAHKVMEAAPDVLPLLQLLDRKQTAEAGMDFLNRWLASEQKASDRWAMTLCALLCDSRAILPLKQPIADWAQKSRHKLAEYAAQAIALIPGEEALMVLDSLANTYRSKFKNIGAACRLALQQAAVNRGVSLDDLEDMIVPDFEFNEDRERGFDLSGTEWVAILQPDFKLSWYNPEAEKEQKALPGSASEDLKSEIKAMNKLIRATVKAQSARLEQNLVRQRRWPVPRWQQLFEQHPIMQAFASRLVWGRYTAEGQLCGSFRRYPNGLLATAAGNLVELEDETQVVGMLHPLEIEEEELIPWAEHLARFKVKAPFEQIDRKVERPNPRHANRRSLLLTENKELSYGSFRSRMEKRGWTRGSVADAGGILSYYKEYDTAGVEAVLNLEECWVGMDPMDEVTLGDALFIQAGVLTRGSYEYDQVRSDEKHVLSFGELPAVVYSETVADLRFLLGEA